MDTNLGSADAAAILVASPAPEKVRLVIWDLDDTFWQGTLSEGGITYNPHLHDAVITLARRGIVSAICSKNDLAPVQAELEQRGLWEYFIFPSVDWTPKGPRLRAMVESVQLRAPTVLFIDDNPHNLAEAEHFVPGIQVAGPEILPTLLDNPLLRGKDDSELSRLEQYRLLQRRQQDQTQAGGDAADFLRASGIRVEIDLDLASNLDRAIELINRTNQLNFTKQRLPEDPEAARAALMEILDNPSNQGGILRVQDRYGDYGYAGLFIVRQNRFEPKHLLHFCFSCRILNMGVEHWLYQRIGRPKLEVVGQVLSNPVTDQLNVDWIEVGVAGDLQLPAQPLVLDDVYIRGACHVRPMAHYFSGVSERLHEQFDTVRGGRNMALNHTILTHYGLHGMPAGAHRAFARLGFLDEDFDQFIFHADPERKGLWVLNFWTELGHCLYRHRASGALIPVQFDNATLQNMMKQYGRIARDARTWDAEESGADPELLKYLRSDFDYVGATPPDILARTIADIVRLAPTATQVVILQAVETSLKADGTRRPGEMARRINRIVRESVSAFPHVTLIDVGECVHTDKDLVVGQPLKLSRIVQVRVVETILNRLTATSIAT